MRSLVLLDSFDEWIGGSNYIRSIEGMCSASGLESITINSHQLLREEVSSDLRLSRLASTALNAARKIGVKNKFACKYINLLAIGTAGKPIVVFPCNGCFPHSKKVEVIAWIADLQDFDLPHLFSLRERVLRVARYLFILVIRRRIVFSSNHARDQFNRRFSLLGARDLGSVCNFSAVSNLLDQTDSTVLATYKLRKGYYSIYSAQLWAHKSHKYLLKAYQQFLLQTEIEFPLILTGSLIDPRNPGFLDEIKELVQDLGLSSMVKFLGKIPREDQLSLIENAGVCIQCSSYEGWSTFIEESVYYRKCIFASNIPVHMEQLRDYEGIVRTFDLRSTRELVDILKSFIDSNGYTYFDAADTRGSNSMIRQKRFRRQMIEALGLYSNK